MTIWKTFDEFTCMLNTQKFDIMTLSKTWLKDNPHLLDYVKIDGYEVKFRNREHTRGVGVGLYIRPDIKYKLGQVGWTSFMHLSYACSRWNNSIVISGIIFAVLEINLKLKLKVRNQIFIVKHYLVKNLVKFGKLFIKFSTQMVNAFESIQMSL